VSTILSVDSYNSIRLLNVWSGNPAVLLTS
jgi:hypothetical protein